MPTIIPVAHRGTARLTPAAITTTLPFAAPDYLRAQPPACSCLRSSLVVLAVLTFLGLSFRYFGRRRSKPCHTVPPHDTLLPIYGSAAVENVEGDKASQGSGPSKDDRRRQTTNKNKMGAIKTARAPFSDTAAVLQQDKSHASDAQWIKGSENPHRTLGARPPPPAPFTPPELNTATTTIYFEGPLQRHESFELDENPDYFSATSSPSSDISPVFSAQVRRRSYTRSVPVDISSSQDTSSSPDHERANAFLSTSYPPSHGLLPSAPPEATSSTAAEEGSEHHRRIQVHGEIISSTDENGAGWTRHTRVFGGGACLACAASGGSRHGGYYGPNVRPEDMMH